MGELEQDEDVGAARRKPAPSLIIRIEPPIGHGQERWDQVELREPRVSEVKAAEEVLGSAVTPVAVLEAGMKLLSLVGEVPKEIMEQLPSSVLNEAVEYLNAFEIYGRGFADAGPTLLLELDEPIEVQKGRFQEVPLREPRLSERRVSQQHLSRGLTPATMRAAEIAVVIAVSDLPPAAVHKMPISDFGRAAEYLTGFFEAGRRTGGSSRPS